MVFVRLYCCDVVKIAAMVLLAAFVSLAQAEDGVGGLRHGENVVALSEPQHFLLITGDN